MEIDNPLLVDMKEDVDIMQPPKQDIDKKPKRAEYRKAMMSFGQQTYEILFGLRMKISEMRVEVTGGDYNNIYFFYGALIAVYSTARFVFRPNRHEEYYAPMFQKIKMLKSRGDVYNLADELLDLCVNLDEDLHRGNLGFDTTPANSYSNNLKRVFSN